MKIQQLIEADLFRHQYEWNMAKEPVINVPAREGREANARCIVAYSAHHTLTKMGINVPRRWNSSFAASSVEGNLFLAYVNHRGIRKVVIPEDRPVGYVKGDFNDRVYNEFDAMDIAPAVSKAIRTIPLADRTPTHQTLMSAFHDGMDEAESTFHTNDAGYKAFERVIKIADVLLAHYKLPTYTERLVAVMQKFVERGSIGAATASTLPEGKFEVWFEGPYDAHINYDYDEEEDGPDPHDLDR